MRVVLGFDGATLLRIVGSNHETAGSDTREEASLLHSPELRILFGIAFHSLPSRILPELFFRTPPHCLKKKATLAARHCLRISLTHSGLMGRDLGPDSPPTTTQEIPCSGKESIGESKGSIDKNLMAAGICLNSSILL